VEHDAVDGAEVTLDARELLVFENLKKLATTSNKDVKKYTCVRHLSRWECQNGKWEC
jgi:hypothetical protein